MKVEIIKKDGEPIGWTIVGETQEEKYTVNTIRNLQFFGFDETSVKYGGRTGSGYEDAGKLIWVQRQHSEGIQEFVKQQNS